MQLTSGCHNLQPAGFPWVLKSPEFRVFKIQDLKSPEIGQWS